MAFLKECFLVLMLAFSVCIVLQFFFVNVSVDNPKILSRNKANNRKSVISEQGTNNIHALNVINLQKFISKPQAPKTQLKSKKQQTTVSETKEYFKPRTHDVNHVNFTFLLNHPELCRENQPYVLFLVHSTAKNFKVRNTIRNSWVGALRSGHWNESHALSEKAMYLFLLGNSTVNEEVQKENEKFKDILLMSFQEDYRNTIYKTYMSLRWFRAFCGGASFVVKVDEDVFVHVPNVIAYVRRQSESSRADVNKTIYGVLSGSNVVYRSPKSFKWTVSFEEYPLPQYPPHPSGGIYFMSGTVAMAIINMADYLPLVHIEDAFFGGILRHALGFRVVSPEIHLATNHIRGTCWFYARKNTLLALHRVGDYNMGVIMRHLPFLNETACTDNERVHLKEIYKDE